MLDGDLQERRISINSDLILQDLDGELYASFAKLNGVVGSGLVCGIRLPGMAPVRSALFPAKRMPQTRPHASRSVLESGFAKSGIRGIAHCVANEISVCANYRTSTG